METCARHYGITEFITELRLRGQTKRCFTWHGIKQPLLRTKLSTWKPRLYKRLGKEETGVATRITALEPGFENDQ